MKRTCIDDQCGFYQNSLVNSGGNIMIIIRTYIYTSQKKKRYTDFMMINLSDNTLIWSELLNITRLNFNKDKNVNKTD